MTKFVTAIAGIFSGLFSAIFGKKDVPAVTIPAVDISQETVDHVIEVVNNVKKAVESPAAIIVTDLIPGTMDNTALKLVDDAIAPVLAGLVFVKSWLTAPTTTDRNVLVNDIISKVKLSDDADKNALYHSLAARLIVVASDGKVTWSEAVSVIEIYFKNFFGTTQTA